MQTHWKLTVEILIDQFSCKNYEKRKQQKTTKKKLGVTNV